MRGLILLCLCCTSSLVAQVWNPNVGKEDYRNPIISADYSDPDVLRIGSDYYMTASSFNCLPGLPILHSKDLVNWTLVNHAVRSLAPAAVFDLPQHGKGVWAPSFYQEGEEVRIYYGDPDYGIFMVKTKDVRGEWEEPLLVLPGKGIIDPAVFRDTDGKMYLAVAWAASRAGINSVLTLFQLNEEGTQVLDKGKHIFDGHDKHHTVEGPKLYKRNGYYYIFAPAGGVATGWQLVLRSKDIYGPFEEKVVLAQGNTPVNGPHQGSWVHTAAGEDWFIHFQDQGVYGRVIHLQPMRWEQDWPIMGEKQDAKGLGQPVMRFKKPVGQGEQKGPQETDHFNTDTLGLQWQWQANPKIQWSALLRGAGYLRLFHYPVAPGPVNLWHVPNLLMQKFPAPEFTATAALTQTLEWDVWQGKKAGLVIMGNDYAYLSIARDQEGYKVEQGLRRLAAEDGREDIVAVQRIAGPKVYLRVKVMQEGKCQFYFSEDNTKYTPIGEVFQAQPDRWVGAKVGLFSIADPAFRAGGYADIDWFTVDK